MILNEGAPDAAGNTAVIAAVTGLGEASMYWDGKQHRPFAGEGGHADFAPQLFEIIRWMANPEMTRDPCNHIQRHRRDQPPYPPHGVVSNSVAT